MLSPKSIQFHPLCKVDHFGQNKLGNNLYRVVYAPSRMYLVGKTWDDGKTEYRFMPLYRAKGWILERYMTAFEYCKMSRERWEIENRDPRTGLYITGPYPDRGEYEMCWDFEMQDPTQGYCERLIGMIEAGRLKSYNEHFVANQRQMDAEDKAKDARTFDQIKDSMPTFCGRPGNMAGSIRNLKTRPDRLSANQLRVKGKPLPIGNRKFAAA